MDYEFEEKWWSLSALLQVADDDDLVILVEHLTDKGKGRSSLSDTRLKQLTACSTSGVFGHSDRNDIAREIRLFGGNSFANALRGGEGAAYQGLVIDAAKHLKVDVEGWESAPSVETQILRKLFLNAFDAMPDDKRRTTLSHIGLSGLAESGRAEIAAALREAPAHGEIRMRVAAFVAESTASSVLGRGLAVAGGAGVGAAMLASGALAAAATVVVPFSLVYSAMALAAPAYRVFVPCVVQVAYIREKARYTIRNGGTLDVVGSSAASETMPSMPPIPEIGSHVMPSLPKVKRIKTY
ncbi:hypothetical protein WK39_10650 [Burkholderia cepacia]|uniref:hypothetical protein n=1 Tax=Burkholderia cepacia TaxID=292 RepID=UPI0007574140|nr:hypothetical protein [Burkholderia cepacia]KUY70285.1 hypothetical protein WI27_04060 [Burkholderia cepacia]KVE79604.1 hypothetical protein WI99_28235 [Burkholderia cepacia]KVS62109.1 hypothetical protein WK39_10650 [Burkholderia cepacia]KVS75080.1 hypothetical protein WK40_35335 [Burkholderia cepacia]KWB23340.1 hypothetical protein WL32_11145 [Burkholderia cepacia]